MKQENRVNDTGSGIAVTNTAAAAAQLLRTDCQPLPSGVLVNRPLQPLMIRLLASCCVIVRHPLLLWHTVMGLLTLLLPVAFVLFSCCAMVRLSHLSSHPLSCNCQCSWRTLPSDTLNASHHPSLPFLSMLACCLCHLLPDPSSATCFCCALIAGHFCRHSWNAFLGCSHHQPLPAFTSPDNGWLLCLLLSRGSSRWKLF